MRENLTRSTHIIILGAGISGLCIAWFLKQICPPQVKITLIEKSHRCGGWIETKNDQGFLFDKGPRSFRTKSLGPATATLIEQLLLSQEIISADRSAVDRFLFTDGKLKVLPNHLWQLPFSALTKGWFNILRKEWLQKKGSGQDESISSFFERHLGPKWTSQFIDPLISGIYAGDIERLSIKSCFPQLLESEQKYGSLIKGFWYNRKNQVNTASSLKRVTGPLFSFREGMQVLVNQLASHLKAQLYLGSQAAEIQPYPQGVHLRLTCGKKLEADYLISTLPTYYLAPLLDKKCALLASKLHAIPYTSVRVVHLAYDQLHKNLKGFGYLIPSKEKEKVVGCIWDSAVFPQQNHFSKETRLTVMAGGAHHRDVESWSEEQSVELALDAVKRQLDISQTPQMIFTHLAKKSIPQFLVGHAKRLCEIKEIASRISPRLILTGSAFSGVSVNDCIERANTIANDLAAEMNTAAAL